MMQSDVLELLWLAQSLQQRQQERQQEPFPFQRFDRRRPSMAEFKELTKRDALASLAHEIDKLKKITELPVRVGENN